MQLPDAPYAFRPAKRIQRVMFCDAVRLLRAIRPIEEYRYIGLGHWQFVDFELMRREVGVQTMVSIEKNTAHQARFEENKPFGEVDLLFGEAFEKLQEIDLTIPTIAWLDYTSKLTSGGLRDLKFLTEQLPAGSVIAATFNCHPDREDQRLESLIRALGEVVPGDIDEDELGRDGLPRVQRRILKEQLDAVAAARTPAARMEQFMFLRYMDRTPMMFWAALLVDESIDEEIAPVLLSRLEQFRDRDDFLDVSVPWLTTREVIGLNEQIKTGQVPTLRGLDRAECEAYAKLHRWYPVVPLPL
ncbi:MAG: O-methyltransferase [Solirubrobacteraceae bacterium]